MKNLFFIIRLSIALIIFILAIIAMAGLFYPIHIFDIQMTPVLQRVISDFSIIALVLFISVAVITFLFGRIYCSLICPMGIFQEIICLIRNKNNNETGKSYPFKYFIAALTMGLLIGGSALFIRYIDPYTLFGSAVTLSLTGIIAIIIIGVLAVFKNRLFCTDICPVGCILGLLAKVSLFKIYIEKDKCMSCSLCERSCPAGCIDSKEQTVRNETCIKCFKCLGKCYKNAIKYGIKYNLVSQPTADSSSPSSCSPFQNATQKNPLTPTAYREFFLGQPKEEIKFNIKRRELIISASALIVFAGAIKYGLAEAGKAVKKFKDIILPPGAFNPQRMFNKCLNCNLCIEACPNKILTKANDNFGAVHINYEQGEKYCKYDCNECSKVCPSGAIKRIPLEEKQHTRIAMAVINQDKCTGCGICNIECPAKAIYRDENGKSIINASKCIGCGACKKSCNFSSIEIFAIKEQKVI